MDNVYFTSTGSGKNVPLLCYINFSLYLFLTPFIDNLSHFFQINLPSNKTQVLQRMFRCAINRQYFAEHCFQFINNKLFISFQFAFVLLEMRNKTPHVKFLLWFNVKAAKKYCINYLYFILHWNFITPPEHTPNHRCSFQKKKKKAFSVQSIVRNEDGGK